MKNIQYIRTLFIALIGGASIMASCEEKLVGEEKANTPVNNFELFWKTFDEHYGMFDVKKIDWNAMHDKYRSQVNDQMTDEQLYTVLTDMMIQLNDNHLNLYPTNGELPVFPGGVFSYRDGKVEILKVQDDYDLEVCKTYTTDYQQVTGNIGYGKLPDNIVYINIKGTDDMKDAEKAMEKITASIQNASGVVVDIRGFYGGYDPVSQLMAGSFASERKMYMTTRKRSGAASTEFTPALEWYVEPKTGHSYIKNVVMLTSRFTQSAGETFGLALRQFDHIKSVGDTTAGSFSDNPNFELLNGWMFSVSVGDYRGPAGISYEGFGMPPDVYGKTTRKELLNGKDTLLERAVALLKK
jgi:carboxyl-terminal processing protease